MDNSNYEKSKQQILEKMQGNASIWFGSPHENHEMRKAWLSEKFAEIVDGLTANQYVSIEVVDRHENVRQLSRRIDSHSCGLDNPEKFNSIDVRVKPETHLALFQRYGEILTDHSELEQQQIVADAYRENLRTFPESLERVHLQGFKELADDEEF